MTRGSLSSNKRCKIITYFRGSQILVDFLLYEDALSRAKRDHKTKNENKSQTPESINPPVFVIVSYYQHLIIVAFLRHHCRIAVLSHS